MSILVLWKPAYGVEALVKLFTAAVSVITAIALWPLLPKGLALLSPAQRQAVNGDLRGDGGRARRRAPGAGRMPGALDGWAVARRGRELDPAMRVIYATGFSADVLPMIAGALFFRKLYRLTAVLESARQLGVG